MFSLGILHLAIVYLVNGSELDFHTVKMVKSSQANANISSEIFF